MEAQPVEAHTQSNLKDSEDRLADHANQANVVQPSSSEWRELANVMQQSSSEWRELEEHQRRQMRDETDKAMEAILSEHTLDVDDSPLGSALRNSWLSQKQLGGKRNHQVWLHIYDLDPVVAKLNDYALRAVGMGAFHCGVEVLGDEWFFAWGDDDSSETGVLFTEPKSHQVHVYKESIDMGKSPLTQNEVKTVISNAMEAWPTNSYNIVNRNCVHFAEDLLLRLQVPEPFPMGTRCS